MKHLKPAAAALLALSMLPACNTIAGIGKDLQAGGEAISETSAEVRDHLSGENRPVETASADGK